MKDKWGFGTKFRDYLALNFQIVKGDYVYMIILTLATFISSWMVISAVFWLVKGYIKLYSASLYQKEACLYQSLPVSSFETAAAKMAVGTLGSLIIIGGLLVNSYLVQSFNLPQVFMINPLLMGSRGDMGLQILTVMVCIMGTVLMNGIILFGVAAGNRMRGSRDRKPKLWAVVMVVGAFIVLVYGVVWFMKQLSFLNEVLQYAILLVLAAAGSVIMFSLNVRALERWYSV